MRPTFLFGKLYAHGLFSFFPGVFLVKTTLTLMVLLAVVPFAGLRRRGRREFIFLLIPAIAFLLIAIASRLSLGVRHILPIYPFLILLAAGAVWELARRSRALKIALAVLLIFAAISSLHAFPDYLAYSNEAFGGPSNTYRVLTDSNVDWGQGLKATKRYLDRDHVSDCWFAYSNPFADPKYYGIGCRPLPCSWALFGLGEPDVVPDTITGTILISGTEQKGLLWGPGGLNPYDQFNSLRPVAQPANAILAYRGTFHIPLAAAYSHASAAIILTREQKAQEALVEAEAAVKLAPNSAAMEAVLGQTLMAAGRSAEGKNALDQAMNLVHADHPEFQGMLLWMIARGAAGK